jgi:hypothetical protein
LLIPSRIIVFLNDMCFLIERFFLLIGSSRDIL